MTDPLRIRNKEIRRVRVADIQDAPWNFRTHPKKQAEALDGTLDQLGFYGYPEVFVAEDGTLMLVDGHLRKERLLARYGAETEIEVNVTDFTELEAKAATATKDALAGMAGFDAQRLDLLLPQVTFASAATSQMLKDLAKAGGATFGQPAVIPDDEAPAPPAVPTAQPGDVWLLGKHRLMCGDSTNAVHVATLLDGNVPFLMVTDPPYGVDYDPEWRLNAGLNKEHQTRAEGRVENDTVVDWSAAYKLFPGHVAYVWHAGRYAADLVINLRAAEFEVRTQIIWMKKSLVIGRGHYHWQHEPCWYAVRKGGSAKWCGDRTQSTIWQIENMHRTQGNVDDGKTVHSTQKPIECMARPIRNHGDGSDDVYDPFVGSGTTLIACEHLARRCFAMELSPAYVDVVIARWEKLTGQKAKRDESKTAQPA